MNDNKESLLKNQDVPNVPNQKNQIQEFRLKKLQNEKIARLYDKLGKKEKAAYLRNCSSHPTFSYNKKTGERKLVGNFFCRQRMCPLCSWQKSRQTFGNIFKIINTDKFKELEFIFITLTIKNCSADDLQKNLDMMFQGWRKMTASKKAFFRKPFEGCFRALEVTYNKKNKSYHPHFHVLVAVKKEYFSKENKDYISQEKLILQWKKVCDLDYEPNVDVRKVKNKEQKAVAEVAKYTVKSADIANKEVLKTLDSVLFHRRLISYHDLFKTVKTELKIVDEDIESNFKADNLAELSANPDIILELFKWNLGTKTYVLSESREQTKPINIYSFCC